jgi:cell division protein FtsI/penicillin-binding protein 2
VHDALGRPIRTETVTPASVGKDIQTTLDAAIQGKTEEALAEAGEHFEAKGASAIVMNPNTGEILAMANWPGYDPRISRTRPTRSSRTERRVHLRAGSTFKAFTVAAALRTRW